MEDDRRHDDDDEELVELISVQGEMNARVILGVLGSEGIEGMMRSHQTFSALPFTVDGMGAVRIMVRREDLDRARLILEEYSNVGDEDNAALREMLARWKPPEGPPH